MITLRKSLRSFVIVTTLGYIVIYAFVYKSTTRKKRHIKETKRQPHILFILVDDLGWNDVGKICFLFLFIQAQKYFVQN